MITIDVRGLDGVKKKLDSIPRELQGRTMQAAINKTAQKARTEINRAITQGYVVKAGEVRNAIDLHSARAGSLKAVIDIFGSKNRRGRSANMIHFLAVATAAGMTFKARGAVGVKKSDIETLKGQLGFLIRKGGGLKHINGAFIGNKGRTVFMREGKERLPIKPVQVIGFSQMFNARRINERVMAKVRADFVVEVDRAIKYVIQKTQLS